MKLMKLHASTVAVRNIACRMYQSIVSLQCAISHLATIANFLRVSREYCSNALVQASTACYAQRFLALSMHRVDILDFIIL